MLALLQENIAGESGDPESIYGDISVFKVGPFDSPSVPPPSSQVLIKVYAAALNPVDIKRAGAPLEKAYPVVVGYDVAGVVEAVAPDVTEFKAGDRVFGDLLPKSLGPKETGSIAELALCRADLLARVPDGVSFVSAAAIPLVSMTAIQALRQAGMHPGANVFVNAGSGGIGLHLMQIAKAMFSAGAVATTASAAKTDLVKQYGADQVVDYKSQDAGEVLAGWADVVVDILGQFDMARKIRKDGGTAVSIVGPSEPDIEFCLIEPCAKDMTSCASLLAEGKLVPVIDVVYDLQDGIKALERQASARASGKVMIKVRDES